MNGIADSYKPDQTLRTQSRLSKQQKTMLQRLLNNNLNLKKGTSTSDLSHVSAQRLWSKIAIKLNRIPGAQKTWMQWRKVVLEGLFNQLESNVVLTDMARCKKEFEKITTSVASRLPWKSGEHIY